MRLVRGFHQAREVLLRKRRSPLSLGPLPPSVRQRIEAAFGKRLTAPQAVARILDEVRTGGDEALLSLSRRLDEVETASLEVSRQEIALAYEDIDRGLLEALRMAADRVRSYHQTCLRRPSLNLTQEGLGQLVRPLERVGVYAPGGTASYPSTVLMTAIPAQVAGVPEVMLCTPARSPATLVAADLAGVKRVFRVGGAQAIAALAFGTATIPRVDKICGPGNIFVQLAKKAVYGMVGIDGLQGPTETAIIADASARPALCAADLLAQAEHDPLASAILITTSASLAREVKAEVERQLEGLERQEIARESLRRRGLIALVQSMEEALELANEYAPEHLCLLVSDPWSYVGQVRHAGGLFLGEGSPEALGDYMAGPSHVMPTGGTARFSSALGVEDFLKFTSLVALNTKASRDLAGPAARIARAEGLTAHAKALERRLSNH
ncbi:MAG: histidinol dehydrogenase [Chloroflexota bacterium]|nr:histidinol dehydrogenase [Chloroflexota bacterium]